MLNPQNTQDQNAVRSQDTRRSFLKSAALGAALPALITTARGENEFEIRRAEEPLESGTFGPNDRVRIATIGMGIIGFIDTETALKVPGGQACRHFGSLRRAASSRPGGFWRSDRGARRLP